MDLFAHRLSEESPVEEYVRLHYGEVPRMRGIRLMRLEEPRYCTDETEQGEMFRRHCGQDVVHVHTRCGSAWWGDGDPDANYIACGGKAWEEANADTFIESCNDFYDGTYRDHYFRAVPGPDYDAALASVRGFIQGLSDPEGR